MTFTTTFKYFLLWQAGIVIITLFSGNLFPLQKSDSYLGGGITHYLANPLLNSRSNFDGVHYALIATHGYSFGQQAFFPLYPDLIRHFRAIVADPIWAGVIISSACFLAGMYFLSRLIEIDYSPQISKWTIIALLAFPTSFFFSAVYTEGLFFLLVILSFYSARKSNWLLAGIFGGLASYTRLVGIFIFPALLAELWSSSQSLQTPFKKIFTSGAFLLLIPLGLLVYMNYLKDTTGDALAFFHVQKTFNQERSLSVVMPYQVYWRYLKMLFTVSWQNPIYFTLALEFAVGLLFSFVTLISLFRQRFSYALYSLFAFAVATFTGNLVSIPRYVLVCFPAFILIGTVLSKYPKARLLILSSFIIVGIISLSMFVQGYWLA